MSREIKFRVWNGSYMNYDFQYLDLSTMRFYNDWMDVEDGRNIKDAVLMQFTGFKDKNGVKIYEGDIDNKGRVCKYFDDLGCFGFKSPNHSHIHFVGEFVKRECFIVGNIYENPDLL